MIRQGGTVLALALLPTLSAAQIPTGADRTHTVRAGESHERNRESVLRRGLRVGEDL